MHQVLLIDDHALYREGLALLLAERFQAVEVAQAGDFLEAEAGRRRLGRLDLIVLDLAQRDCDGVATLARCRSMWPGVPVVVLVDREPADTIKAVLAQGVAGLISKTARAEPIELALRAVLQPGADGLPKPAGAAVVLGPAAQRGAGFEPGPAALAMPGGPGPEAGLATDGLSLGLSPRQLDVLRLLAAGQSNKQISRALGVAESTIKTHLNGLFQKLGVSRRAEALIVASELGLREPSPGGPSAAGPSARPAAADD